MTAQEDGYKVLSAMGHESMNQSGTNVFAVKIERINALRIGLVTDDFRLQDMVGEDHQSWALMSTGDVNHHGHVSEFVPPLMEGDIVAVVSDRNEGTIGLNLNGEDKGVAFQGDELKRLRLYPAVTL